MQNPRASPTGRRCCGTRKPSCTCTERPRRVAGEKWGMRRAWARRSKRLSRLRARSSATSASPAPTCCDEGAAMSAAGDTGPLAGLRILDLTRLLPGPVCTLYLADLGADVVKIEDTGVGDYARNLGNRPGTVSAFYRAVNRNKRSAAVDLKDPRGRDAFLALAKRADAIVESF